MNDVRYWPKADIASCTAHVRFWRESGHDRLRMSAFAVAIGCKADMAFCGITLSRSLSGVKRKWLFAPHMSAFDPKRTCCSRSQIPAFGIAERRVPSSAPQDLAPACFPGGPVYLLR